MNMILQGDGARAALGLEQPEADVGYTGGSGLWRRMDGGEDGPAQYDVVEGLVMGLQLEDGLVLDELIREADSDEERHRAVFGSVPLDEVVVEACAVAKTPARAGKRYAG